LLAVAVAAMVPVRIEKVAAAAVLVVIVLQ
jgi:hypothetical protein